MPRHLKSSDSLVTKDLKRVKKRKTLNLDDMLDRNGFKGLKLIRRKVNPEAKKQINIIIDNINEKTNLAPDTAVKALSTLKSLYLIDVELGMRADKQIYVKRWFEVKE